LKVQFTLKINKSTNNEKGKEKNSDKLAMLSKLPSLILAKSLKKVNKIFKFFKKNNNKTDEKIVCLSFNAY